MLYFSQATGTYFKPFKLTGQCDEKDIVLRYTSDGTEPTALSNQFPVSGLLISSNCIVKACRYSTVGVKVGTTTTLSYTFKSLTTPAPEADTTGLISKFKLLKIKYSYLKSLKKDFNEQINSLRSQITQEKILELINIASDGGIVYEEFDDIKDRYSSEKTLTGEIKEVYTKVEALAYEINSLKEEISKNESYIDKSLENIKYFKTNKLNNFPLKGSISNRNVAITCEVFKEGDLINNPSGSCIVFYDGTISQSKLEMMLRNRKSVANAYVVYITTTGTGITDYIPENFVVREVKICSVE